MSAVAVSAVVFFVLATIVATAACFRARRLAGRGTGRRHLVTLLGWTNAVAGLLGMATIVATAVAHVASGDAFWLWLFGLYVVPAAGVGLGLAMEQRARMAR